MRDISRREFVKYGAATVAGASLFDLSALDALAAKAPTLAPPVDLKTLAKRAQAEGGQCLVYLGSADLATALSDGFKKAYPWATANTVVSSTGAILTKVFTEVTAKKGADVFSVTPVQPYLHIRAGTVTPVALVNDVNAGPARDPHGYWHPYARNVQIFAVNPNLAGYVPSDIYELIKPAFKGQFAMDRPANLGTAAVFLASHRKAWGDKKWFAWLQGMQANNIFITSSATSSYQAVLTGERGIAAASLTDVLSQPAGAPVKAFFYQGAPSYVQHLMRSSYSANPNTADLFINWVMSKDGQTIVASTGRTPAMDLPGVATAISTVVPKNRPIAPYSQLAGFIYNPDPYNKIFNNLWPS